VKTEDTVSTNCLGSHFFQSHLITLSVASLTSSSSNQLTITCLTDLRSIRRGCTGNSVISNTGDYQKSQ